MKLQVGKYYRTRDGRKAGPLTRLMSAETFYYNLSGGGQGCCYANTGLIFADGRTHGTDLVAEWSPSAPKETAPAAVEMKARVEQERAKVPARSWINCQENNQENDTYIYFTRFVVIGRSGKRLAEYSAYSQDKAVQHVKRLNKKRGKK